MRQWRLLPNEHPGATPGRLPSGRHCLRPLHPVQLRRGRLPKQSLHGAPLLSWTVQPSAQGWRHGGPADHRGAGPAREQRERRGADLAQGERHRRRRGCRPHHQGRRRSRADEPEPHPMVSLRRVLGLGRMRRGDQPDLRRPRAGRGVHAQSREADPVALLPGRLALVPDLRGPGNHPALDLYVGRTTKAAAGTTAGWRSSASTATAASTSSGSTPPVEIGSAGRLSAPVRRTSPRGPAPSSTSRATRWCSPSTAS